MRKTLSLLVALCLVASTVAVIPAGAASYPLSGSDSDVFTASSGNTNTVHAWERGVFPLRVSPDANAVSVQNPNVRVQGTGLGEKSLGKDQMLVFNPGTEISLSFNAGERANSPKLDNENVQIIAAQITGGEGDGVPNTFSDALDLLTQENINQNATFEFVTQSESLDDLGSSSFTYNPPQAGHYVFFAVTSDGNDGVQISDGKITIQEDITVVGADAVPVQRGPPAEVSPSTNNPDPGENVNFNVEVTNQLSSNGVTHVLAVYKQDTFRSSTHTIIVDPNELDQSFDIQQDSTFEHSIAKVDGVADVEEGASINGIELEDGRVSRSVGAGAMIDFIAENLSTSAPSTTPTDTTVLNASLDADVDTAGDTQLTIETNNDWETGTYRYVYLGSLEDDETAIATSTGSFEIGAEPNNRRGGSSGGSDDDDEVGDITAPATPVQVTTQLDADGTATADLTDGTSVTQVQVLNPGATGDVTVTELTDLPEGTPEPANQRVATVDISAPDPDEGSTATVRVSVRAAALPADASPENLVISHYIDGQWRDLETSVVSTGESIVVEAQTDGFSPFAVTYQQVTATPEPDTATPAPDTATPEPDTATPGPETETQTPQPGDGGGNTGVLIAVLVVIALIAVGAYFYQQNN